MLPKSLTPPASSSCPGWLYIDRSSALCGGFGSRQVLAHPLQFSGACTAILSPCLNKDVVVRPSGSLHPHDVGLPLPLTHCDSVPRSPDKRGILCNTGHSQATPPAPHYSHSASPDHTPAAGVGGNWFAQNSGSSPFPTELDAGTRLSRSSPPRPNQFLGFPTSNPTPNERIIHNRSRRCDLLPPPPPHQ